MMTTMTTDPAAPTYVQLTDAQFASVLFALGALVALVAALLIVQIGRSNG